MITALCDIAFEHATPKSAKSKSKRFYDLHTQLSLSLSLSFVSVHLLTHYYITKSVRDVLWCEEAHTYECGRRSKQAPKRAYFIVPISLSDDVMLAHD